MRRILLAMLLPVAVAAQNPRPSSLGWSDAWLDFPVSLARYNHSALTTNRSHLPLDMRPIGAVVTNFAGAWCYYTSGNPTNSHLRLYENEQSAVATICLECEVEPGQGFTAMAWFWLDGSPPTSAAIFSSYTFVDGPGGWFGLVRPDLNCEGAMRAGCDVYVSVEAGPGAVAPNRWTHVALVRNTSGQLLLYLDGSHVATSVQSCSGGMLYSALRGLSFGTMRYESANLWQHGLRGCVTGFRYYRRALSDSEIMAIFSEGLP